MVATMLTVTSGIGAMRLGEHWKFDADESEALAEPITAILDRYDLTKLTGKYGDWIALFTALGMVITPRVMYSMELAKQKGGNNNARLQSVPQRQQQQPAAAGAGAGANTETRAPNGDNRAVQERPAPLTSNGIKSALAHFG